MPAASARQGQSSKDKVIAAIAILCVLIAAIVIYKVWAAQQIQIAVTIPTKPGSAEKAAFAKENQSSSAPSGKAKIDTDSIDPSAGKTR